jgi:hypothetical protein
MVINPRYVIDYSLLADLYCKDNHIIGTSLLSRECLFYFHVVVPYLRPPHAGFSLRRPGQLQVRFVVDEVSQEEHVFGFLLLLIISPRAGLAQAV